MEGNISRSCHYGAFIRIQRRQQRTNLSKQETLSATEIVRQHFRAHQHDRLVVQDYPQLDHNLQHHE